LEGKSKPCSGGSRYSLAASPWKQQRAWGGGGIEEDDVLELLPHLVDKSLVVADESWERGHATG
jgi:hypothetical protein